MGKTLVPSIDYIGVDFSIPLSFQQLVPLVATMYYKGYHILFVPCSISPSIVGHV